MADARSAPARRRCTAMSAAGGNGQQRSVLPTMMGSALSGMLARIPCHPLDTIKSRLQVMSRSGIQYKGLGDAMVQTVRSEGFRGLYRGLGIAFMGSAPAACLYFTSYEWSKQRMEGDGPGGRSSVHLAAGMFAETLSCVLWVPIDVIKERMQVQNRPPPGSEAAAVTYYRNTLHATRTIMGTEGIRGIYRGYGATVLSFGPFSALFFMGHEKLKEIGLQWVDKESSVAVYALSGATAGGMASFLTNPLDVVKLRLQVQRGMVAKGETPMFEYRNFFHGLRCLAREEGVAGMFRGVSARMLFHAPATAVSITLFETCRELMSKLLGYS